jgi:hypothetical protein
MDDVLLEPWTVERFLAWKDEHEFDGAHIAPNRMRAALPSLPGATLVITPLSAGNLLAPANTDVVPEPPMVAQRVGRIASPCLTAWILHPDVKPLARGVALATSWDGNRRHP